LNGAEFDRAYMEEMVSGHKQAIALFRREADHGADPDIKAFASRTLPTIQHHLQLAEDTLNAVKR
jgi:putative membrane protein